MGWVEMAWVGLVGLATESLVPRICSCGGGGKRTDQWHMHELPNGGFWQLQYTTVQAQI